MPYINQVEGFRLNTIFWTILGIWPKGAGRYYKYYMPAFIFVFCIFYDILFTVNFYFIPKQLDKYIEDMIFYFTELTVASKVLTFFFMYHKIEDIFKALEKETFQPETEEDYKIIEKAKRFNRVYYYITVTVSMISHLTHIFTPLILRIFLSVPLELPISSYLFLPKDVIERFIYPLYFYQVMGMHSHVWYNVNIDTFFLGIMILMIAQLDILDGRLRKITDIAKTRNNYGNATNLATEAEKCLVLKLNKSINHFDEVGHFMGTSTFSSFSIFCSLIQQIFGVTLFVQFSMASAIICICVFRFTMPAPVTYYIFLSTYMSIMIIQILVPCWFGTRIIEKSEHLSRAVYDCDWTVRPRMFKTNMRLFVERTKCPLTIFGWKMFPLSLKTFTSIINTAYSFFTLLRHVQSRQ